MKSELKLAAATRQPGRQALSQLRAQGFIPAVVYGPKTENLHIQIKKTEALKIYDQAGESSLITLDIDGKDQRQVIVKDIHQSSVKDLLIHMDFFQVDMAEKVTTEVELNFIGEAPAVKQLGGVVVKNFDAVEIECLPKDLINELDVDLSILIDFDAHITFADLKLPKGVALSDKHELNEIIVAVEEPRAVAVENASAEETPAEEAKPETAGKE
ncbi:50S ribosomal protein L25 [Candidatus Falkowbacteria bacterium]|nr:50S ribosomal protein L25 [Candidatus Falkowbacteria bacterium]